MNIDIEELRNKLKDYYGTAATVIGRGNPLACPGAFAEMLNIDNLSDEEVIIEAQKCGII